MTFGFPSNRQEILGRQQLAVDPSNQHHDLDEKGRGFDGGKRYQLVVPEKIPARQFRTVTLYDNSTRSLLLNESKNAELGSLSDLVYNSDGSATVTFSPTKGNAKNWIQH